MIPPKKIILIYPVGHLRCLDFSPSILMSLNETLLTHTLIDIVYTMYLRENKELIEDPYVSPLMVHKDMISLMPKMSIYFGTKDPLYDDGLRLFQKMV